MGPLPMGGKEIKEIPAPWIGSRHWGHPLQAPARRGRFGRRKGEEDVRGLIKNMVQPCQLIQPNPTFLPQYDAPSPFQHKFGSLMLSLTVTKALGDGHVVMYLLVQACIPLRCPRMSS